MRKENRQENEVITIYATLNRADRCTYFLSLSFACTKLFEMFVHKHTRHVYNSDMCRRVLFI
jgi:hypothetical protein